MTLRTCLSLQSGPVARVGAWDEFFGVSLSWDQTERNQRGGRSPLGQKPLR